MNVSINGEQQTLDDGAAVRAAIELLGARDRGTAVALNGEVVPRSGWETTALTEGDRVEVLVAVQGG